MCTYHPKSKEDESTKTLTVVTNKLCQADFVPYCLKMLKEYADQMNSRDENKHTRKVLNNNHTRLITKYFRLE